MSRNSRRKSRRKIDDLLARANRIVNPRSVELDEAAELERRRRLMRAAEAPSLCERFEVEARIVDGKVEARVIDHAPLADDKVVWPEGVVP